MYYGPVYIVRVKVDVVGRLFGLQVGQDGHDFLIHVVRVKMIGQFHPEQELVVLERDETRYLKFVDEVLVNFFVTHVMQLYTYESSSFFCY